MTTETTFWHYTCEHAYQAIGQSGLLLPPLVQRPSLVHVARGGDMLVMLSVVWFTDQDDPDRDALGLTMETIRCDRAAHRYRVTDPIGIVPYRTMRGQFSPQGRRRLETEPRGVKPQHWFVSYRPVPAVYDPVGVHV